MMMTKNHLRKPDCFFELNDTDEDLGIHGKVDGDEWKRLEIEGPDKRLMMKIRVRGGLKRQGLAELFLKAPNRNWVKLVGNTRFLIYCRRAMIRTRGSGQTPSLFWSN